MLAGARLVVSTNSATWASSNVTHSIEIEIDTIVVGENAAQPCAGRGGEGTNTDAFAPEVAWRKLARLCIVKRMPMLKSRQHDIGQQHHRLAERSCHEISDDRHLRDIERPLADHRLEAFVGRRVRREIELDQVRPDRSVLERGRAGMVAEQGAQAHRHLSPPPARRHR
ncbi:hypothetical protein [Bradyrhizobium sp. RDI18]|uniref:hypothetical protein n=1 Tax=Bradyrhizobium sp. RDI18 TaxID=3367400 RepID=UPI00371E34F7